MWSEDWPIVFDQENGKYGSGDHQRLNTFSTPKTFILNMAVLPLTKITLKDINKSQNCYFLPIVKVPINNQEKNMRILACC